jgi:type II secretory pathway component PulM
MNAWWNGLVLRERMLLSAVALIVLFVLLDTLLFEQYRIKNQQLTEQTEQAYEDLEWMKQAVHRLPDGAQPEKKVVSGRVVTFIDQQITRQGLKKQMQQMTPIQGHSVRLRLSEIPFAKLLAFFSSLEGSVYIQEVRILPADTPGVVNVSLVVSNGDTSS